MKTSPHPRSENIPQETFGALTVAAFLLLVAWGNALAMLVFSLVGLVIWFALPASREGGESTQHHGLLVIVLAGVTAFFIAWLLGG